MIRYATPLLLLVLLAPSRADAQRPNELESWYTNWGLGYANVKYPNALDRVIDVLRRSSSVSNVSVYLDLLGFYWPQSEQTVVGGTINAFGDRFEGPGGDIQINGYTIAFSIMHFPQSRIGDGFFLRADAGPSRLLVDGSVTRTSTSDWGLGGLVGGGYGIPVSRQTRVLIHVYYAVKRIEGDNFSHVGIGVSGLF